MTFFKLLVIYYLILFIIKFYLCSILDYSMNKNTLEKLLLEDNYDDEISSVSWLENNKKQDEHNIIDAIKDTDDKPDFDMHIIEDNNEKKVRISLELNVKIKDTIELICIDVDINKIIYLKLADELIK